MRVPPKTPAAIGYRGMVIIRFHLLYKLPGPAQVMRSNCPVRGLTIQAIIQIRDMRGDQ